MFVAIYCFIYCRNETLLPYRVQILINPIHDRPRDNLCYAFACAANVKRKL